MVESCVLCNSNIEEEYGKLKGTCIKVLDEGKNKLVYVCCDCQKEKDWLNQAKIKGA